MKAKAIISEINCQFSCSILCEIEVSELEKFILKYWLKSDGERFRALTKMA